MVLEIFGPVLFGPGDRVLSKGDTDIADQFIYLRQFGFDQLRRGHVTLWNPHVFSGAPFMSAFQSALLYPPNWIYLILPLARAINCEIVLHVFMLGFFMALWVRRYQLHPLAVLFACSLVMFAGPVSRPAGERGTSRNPARRAIVHRLIRKPFSQTRFGWVDLWVP